jgi:hypothetical protein
MHIAKNFLLLRIASKSFVKVPKYDGSDGRDDTQQDLKGVLQFVSGYTYFSEHLFRLGVRYWFCLAYSFLVMSSYEITIYGQKSLVSNPSKTNAYYECTQRHF